MYLLTIRELSRHAPFLAGPSSGNVCGLRPGPPLQSGVSFPRPFASVCCRFAPPRIQFESAISRGIIVVWEHGRCRVSRFGAACRTHYQRASRNPSCREMMYSVGSDGGISELPGGRRAFDPRCTSTCRLFAATEGKLGQPRRLNNRPAPETNSPPCSGILSNTRARTCIHGYLQLFHRRRGLRLLPRLESHPRLLTERDRFRYSRLGLGPADVEAASR